MSNNSATLTPRLRQLLLMLSSDRPGEVTAAAAAIGRALKAAGTDWHGLVDGLLTPWQDAPDDWETIREFCADRCDLLRPREQEFIESLAEWRGRPTERQLAWLCSIYARLRRTT
jgi:hypothetical protein